jgi:hypothetical protein
MTKSISTSFKLFEAASRDVRYAARMVRKRPFFSLAIVLTIALGIGANATIFGVINAVLLEPLPFKEPDRLIRLWESNLGKSLAESPVSVPNFQDWQREQSVFDGDLQHYRLGSTAESRVGSHHR